MFYLTLEFHGLRMMAVWLVASPLRSAKCILEHSRAQERGRLILVEPWWRACGTHSLPDTGDWYLQSLVCRCHLTSSCLKVDLHLNPGETFCETPAGCCPWYENILESILDLCQWMLCSGIRAGSRETEPSVWRGSQGLPQHTLWGKDCYILIGGSCYELFSGQKTLFMSLNSCSAKHDYFKSFHFPPKKMFSLIALCTVYSWQILEW